jgi:hypothetical protein
MRSDYELLSILIVVIAVVILALCVFRDLFVPNAVLFMTDNNVGNTGATKFGLPETFLSGLMAGGPLLGMQGSMAISLENVFKWLMCVLSYVNWYHAVMMCLASVWISLFCFHRGCRALAVMLGIMAAFWLGSGLTLTYSGHNGKYGVLAFAGLALWLIEMAAVRKRLAWAILAGGAVGMMFVEQQDVALFIGFFLGAYAVYAILRENGNNWRALPLPLVLMGLMALLTGGPNVLSGYMTQVKGVVAMSDEDPQKKWEYCTQWSLPPEDMLEFIAPGYRGIRSGEPEGPYWGRVGRSAEWEKTRQGFPNFKLDSSYVGMIPIGLALFALMVAVLGRRGQGSGFRGKESEGRNQGSGGRVQGSGVKSQKSGVGSKQSEITPVNTEAGLLQRRGDIIFWGVVTVLALLLSLGKFFPLYGLFYQIPGMSSIRNPLKFIHVFQIGLGILAAFGADALIRGLPEGLAKAGRRFGIGLLVVAGLLLLWAGSIAGSRDSLINGFVSQGWSNTAPVMVDHMVGAIGHAAVFSLIIGGGILALVAWRQKKAIFRYGAMGVLVLAMVGDVLLLAKDYIKAVSLEELVGDNVVTSFLKENLHQQRAYMLTQEGFYNNWLMVLFPYHHIETFNVSQMPRMPEDYDRWLKAVGRDPIRMWQLSAIGYVLAPDQAWQQIQKEPRFARHFEAVKGFNLVAAGTGVAVIETPVDKPGGHRILRFKDGLPRFTLFNDWSVVGDDVIGDKLVDRAFNPLTKVWVASETAGGLPVPTAVTSGNSRVLDSFLSPTDAKVTAEVASPSVLMFVNKHSPEWRVEVDGKEAPLLRCNSVCLGVYLEPGRHEVRFYLRKQWGLFLTQMSGLLVCLGAMGWLMLSRFRRLRRG